MNFRETKKVIVFDMDGVILDTANLVFSYIKEYYPTVTRDDYRKVFHGNFWHGMAELQQNHEKDPTVDIPRTKIKQSAGLYDGVKELIKSLADSYTLVLNTSAGRENVRQPLLREDILHYFDWVGDKEAGIDKVDKFRTIKHMYDIDFDEMLFITDTIGDVRDAKELNIDTVAVTCGVHGREDFETHCVDDVVAILDETRHLADLL